MRTAVRTGLQAWRTGHETSPQAISTSGRGRCRCKWCRKSLGRNPIRAVRWIVPFAASGGSDITARLMGRRLSERLGQPFVIENRPGAGGTARFCRDQQPR
jgi:hypothetical protein